MPDWLFPPMLMFHRTAVSLSIGLFLARGLGMIAGHEWPKQTLWRSLSVVIDIALLGAGASLWAILSLNPMHNTWLGLKLVLLMAYIALGVIALKRTSTTRTRVVALIAALTVVSAMVGIALARDPAGWWMLLR